MLKDNKTKPSKDDKARLILRHALVARYGREAIARVHQELCAECPDPKCLTGSYCHTFQLAVDACLLDCVREASVLN